MNSRQLLEWGIQTLQENKREENIAYITLKYIDEEAKYVSSDEDLPKEKIDIYKKAINDYIKKDLPIALSFNYVYFYNLKLTINKGCFLPRFETEQLVDEISDYLRQKGHYPKNVIDICTGIGAIPLALKKEFPRIESIDAFDINDKSVACAIKSNKRLKEDVHFFVDDFLTYKPTKKYDVIIMNPPYIASKEYVEDSVLKNDPHSALFSEDEGLHFYKELMKRIELYANKGKFIVCFELGKDQGTLIKSIVEKKLKGSHVKIIKDYQGLDRIIIVEGSI